MVQYIFLIGGFTLLIQGASLFVDGASSLAKRLKVSDLFIGLTVVAFGTSSPELFVNVFASIQGNPGIGIGNILGSNIANVFLILGISAVILPLRVTRNTVWKEIPLGFLAVVLVAVLANDKLIDHDDISVIARIDGAVLISFFIVFLYYTFSIARNDVNEKEQSLTKQGGLPKSLFFILIGLFGLTFGGRLVVDSAVKIAQIFNVSESLIGLTIVALGTSLPELVTSIVAVLKKNTDIAVGNVVGSNIYNIFFILGISAIIKPLPFALNNNFDIFVAILASGLLFVSMFTGEKRLVDRWEGVLFIVLYISYIIFLILRG